MISRGAGPLGGGNAVLIFALILIAYSYFRGGLPSPIQNAPEDPVAFIGFIIAIVLGITVHEFMHAYAAHRMGDDTARHMGRLSLDPRAHLDFFGSLLIVLLGFGYGKPVPVNESRLRSPLAYALVALAGPLTNVALAAVFALPLRLGTADALGGTYERILLLVVVYNCLLAIFNLLPIPPLDGSKVVYGLLPPRQAYTWRSYEQYGPFLLLAIVFLFPYLGFDVLDTVVRSPAAALISALIGGS